MPRLNSTRHELFAQARASGKTATEAYLVAGYSARGHAAEVGASRLMSKAEISRRIDEILRESAERVIINRETLTRMLLDDHELARNEGQAAAARAIVQTIGKLHGFAFDPIKEGGSVPLGQIAHSQLALPPPDSENVVDFDAMAAKFGNAAK